MSSTGGEPFGPIISMGVQSGCSICFFCEIDVKPQPCNLDQAESLKIIAVVSPGISSIGEVHNNINKQLGFFSSFFANIRNDIDELQVCQFVDSLLICLFVKKRKLLLIYVFFKDCQTKRDFHVFKKTLRLIIKRLNSGEQ